MAGDSVFVLGATGPSGLNLLRELLHRNHRTIAYVRDASKIPADLQANPLLEIITAPVTHHPSLSPALARAHTVVSLLGPPSSNMFALATFMFGPPFPYPVLYADHILPLMRDNGVKRILALSTISAVDPENDKFVRLRWVLKTVVRFLAPKGYRAMVEIAEVFRGLGRQQEEQEEGNRVDWTVFRVPGLSGGVGDEEWRREREVKGGRVYVGPVGEGWTGWIGRARLARWLVDCVEGVEGVQGVDVAGNVLRMPAVSDSK